MSRSQLDERTSMHSRAIELLEDADRIALTTHIQPDGDGIGSEVGLALHLRSLGKSATILNPHPTPAKLRFLEPDPPVVPYDPQSAEQILSGADLLVVLDISIPGRLGKLEAAVRRHRPETLVIDHHRGRGGFEGHELRDPLVGATAILVYELLERWGAEITPQIATALYAAIAYDTGGFRYANTRAREHEVAGDLIRRGAQATEVSHRLFASHSLAHVRLVARVLQGFELSPQGRVASSILPLALMKDVGASVEDVDGIVEMLRAIEGVRVAMLLREVAPDTTKVSLRSSGSYDVARFAASYGGGGHRNAAGVLMREPLAVVAARLIPEARLAFDGDPGRSTPETNAKGRE